MDMFTQNEILLMIGVVSVLLICITVLTILDIREYLKEKRALNQNDITFGEEFKEEEVTNSIEVSESSEEKEPVFKTDEILLSDIDDKNDDILLEEVEDAEFIPQVSTISNNEETPKEKKRLDAFLEYEEMENNLPNEKDDITNFEMEQERTAIISLDELLKKSNELYNDNEIVQYDDGNEPISIDEVIKMFNHDAKEVNPVVSEEKQVPEIMQDIVDDHIPYSKKESVPFISSIYGMEKDNALEFENTATYEKLDRKNYNDFVAKLREMNENK